MPRNKKTIKKILYFTMKQKKQKKKKKNLPVTPDRRRRLSLKINAAAGHYPITEGSMA